MTHDENSDQTARDLDRLIAGKDSASLADLTAPLGELRALNVAPAAEDADRVGAVLASAAADVATDGAQAARPAPRRTMRLRAAIAGGAALVVAALVGGTAAADESAPGDVLYGLDRALERIGWGDGGMDERLAEAVRVVDEGDDEGALALVDEIVADVLSADEIAAADEELDAEDEAEGGEASEVSGGDVLAEGPGASDEVHECLRDIIDWMATTDAEGRDFGQGVADRYRDLRHSWFAHRDVERRHDKVSAAEPTEESDVKVPELATVDEDAVVPAPDRTSKPQQSERPEVAEKTEADDPERRIDRDRSDERTTDGFDAPSRERGADRGSDGERGARGSGTTTRTAATGGR
ncbi:hypothetical protein [Demequina subtropica]|uniref:hypothetical protein n=1 Tax=Demequina subtropica TaxID=1638989 RepID=UPI0007808205|nr:hypothetical protein [Demequina subtropica]